MHKVIIDQIEGVYEVRVGCQRTHFLTKGALIYDLTEYLGDPPGVEKKYFAFLEQRERDRKNEAAVDAPESAPEPARRDLYVAMHPVVEAMEGEAR